MNEPPMLTIEEIQRAISKDPDATWAAGTTSVWRRLAEGGDDDGLFGLRLGDDKGRLKASADAFDALTEAAPPPRIDWRSAHGGRLAAIRDQGTCGACVAFATIAAAEAALWIATDGAAELSESELFHCNGGSCDHGWGLAEGLDAATKGLAPLASAAWTDQGVCRGVAATALVTSYAEHRTVDARKRAVARGPVVGGMKVYEDLSAYVGGTYRHVAGAFRGNHAVCVVGYDDAEQHWIIRNSWGAGWGEAGYCTIAYGQCCLDELPFYSCQVRPA